MYFFPNESVHTIVKTARVGKQGVGVLCASTGLPGLIDTVSGEGKPIAEGRRVAR